MEERTPPTPIKTAVRASIEPSKCPLGDGGRELGLGRLLSRPPALVYPECGRVATISDTNSRDRGNRGSRRDHSSRDGGRPDDGSRIVYSRSTSTAPRPCSR